METRRHIIQNQNTKTKEHKLELHILSNEWNKFTEKLNKKSKKAEAFAKERMKRQQMKEENEKMINSWEDSILNICRRKEQKRKQQLKQKETDHMQKFLLLRKEQAALREAFVKEMREVAYKETGYPRELNGALLCSEVYYERERQREFGEMLKKKKEEQEREYAKKVKKDAEEELKEKEEERKRMLQQKQQLKEFYYKQMKEAQVKAEEERRQKLEVDAIDNIKAAEDLQRIENLIKQRQEEYKKEQKEFVLKNLKEHKERKKLELADEKDKDLLIAIQEAAKCRMEMLKKQRKLELEKEVVARRIAISSKVAAAAKEFEEHENMIIKKAQAEWDRKEAERVRMEMEKVKKMREDNIKNYRTAMEEEMKKKELEAEIKRWETMNCYKIEEATKQHMEEEKQKEWEKKIRYRETLKKQIAEKEEIKKLEKEKDLEWFRKQICNKEEHDKFCKYAEEILNTAKEKGRLTYPIEKVIQKYKKENSIALPTFCRKNSRAIIPEKPGKMAHQPETDPNYNKCRNNVELLYDDK